MKKRKLFIIIGVAVCVVFAAVILIIIGAKNRQQKAQDDLTTWEDRITSQVFNPSSELERKIADKVSISVKSVTEDAVTLTASAPDICDELTAWFDTVSDEDYSDDALEKEACALLEKTDVSEKEFTLQIGDDGEAEYSTEFVEYIGCGMFQFYRQLSDAISDALEVG